MTDTDTDAAV